MAKFSIEFDLRGFTDELDKMTEQIKEGVEQGLKVCASEIKQMEQGMIEQRTGNGQYVPTGQLKRSVTIMPLEWSPSLASISVVPTANYATYTEEGTGEFNPQGRKGGWVYPVGDGTYRFTLGMPPKYFARDTYEFYKDKAPAIIEEQVYKCIRR